ncbi:MAG: ATP-binding protein [Candidatus Thermoplasmatota archaeon]
MSWPRVLLHRAARPRWVAGAAILAAAILLPGMAHSASDQTPSPLLDATADVTIGLNLSRFVENATLQNLTARPDSCGTNSHFRIESPTRFVFHESDYTSTECGEFGIVFTPPPGVRTFRVEFSANRSLFVPANQSVPVTGRPARLPSNAPQELHVKANESLVFVRALFPADQRDSPFVPFSVPIELPAGTKTANLSWYFEDAGPTEVGQGIPNPASTDSYVAAVESPRVHIPDYPTAYGAILDRNAVREGNETITTTRYALSTPSVPGASAAPGLRFRLAPGTDFSYVLAPDDVRIDAASLDRVEGPRAIEAFIPPEIVAQHGNGTYAIAIVTRSPVPPPPAPLPPATIYPAVYALLAVPTLPGALAAHASLKYSREAQGRSRVTARGFVWATASLAFIYGAMLAYVLGAARLAAMAVLPLLAEGMLLIALFVLVALAFTALWLIPSRYAMKAMKADMEERRRAEAKFRGLLETAPDAIVIVENSGLVVLTNAQAERMFGRPRDEMIGKRAETILPTRLRSEVGANKKSFFDISRASTAGEPLESVGLRADGREFPIEVTLSPIETESGTLVTAAIRDITDRKRAQSELERSNRELEHFAYVASHDLQEPLRTIAGFTQLLEQRYGEQLDDKGKSYVHRTVAGSKRMQSLINDLLAYSRIQTQGQPFSLVDLDAVVGSMLADLEAVIAQEGARVTRDELPTLYADPSQIGQVFSNLVRNAIKYRHPERKPVIHIGVKKDGDSWLFTVRDNGIGIEREYYDKIFVIFQRLSARTGDEGGTGLGLAITKKIVERHGGLIWVESTPGEGSTFSFSLPDHRANPP